MLIPDLLRVAESINGPDFAPFNEALFIKDPGIGAAVSWHQDGVTHWESEDFNEDIHGFNFMAQVYGSTAVMEFGFYLELIKSVKLILRN
jgi:hypothetical protein